LLEKRWINVLRRIREKREKSQYDPDTPATPEGTTGLLTLDGEFIGEMERILKGWHPL
jgi:hypothetical protein